MDQSFRDEMTTGYALDEPSIVIGSPMHDDEVPSVLHPYLGGNAALQPLR